MNLSYEVKNDYLFVKARGEFIPSAALNVFSKLVEKARSHSLNRIFFDITLITGFDDNQASSITRFEINEFVVGTLPNDMRLTVLVTSPQFKGGRFVRDIMITRCVNVMVTTNLNEALEWLGVT